MLCTSTSGALIRKCLLWGQKWRCGFWFEALGSSRRHISELMVPDFGRPMQLLKGEVNRFRRLAVYVREDFLANRQRSYKCGCCEVIVIRICSGSHIFLCVRCLPESIFDCLLTAMAKVQSVNRKASFLFVGDINAHHEEWFGSSATKGYA